MKIREVEMKGHKTMEFHSTLLVVLTNLLSALCPLNIENIEGEGEVMVFSANHWDCRSS